jgi:hypothetical protein
MPRANEQAILAVALNPLLQQFRVRKNRAENLVIVGREKRGKKKFFGLFCFN